MKNEEDLNRINKELNPMKTIPYFVSIVSLILATYSVLFALMPTSLLVRIMPNFASFLTNLGLYRFVYFLGLAYIFFVFGLFFYVGRNKILRIFRK